MAAMTFFHAAKCYDAPLVNAQAVYARRSAAAFHQFSSWSVVIRTCSIKNWSRILVSLFTLLLLLIFFFFFLGQPFKNRFKSDGDEIWRIVLQRIDWQSDFRYDVIISRWWPWRHFTQKSAAICNECNVAVLMSVIGHGPVVITVT